MEPEPASAPTAEALAESLDHVLDAAGIGWWDLDIVANATLRSPLHDRMFGYEQMLPSWSYDDYLAHVHIEDRAMVARSFETAMAGGEPYAVDVRVVWPDGTVHWLFTRGRFFLSVDGVPLRVAGVVGDITERKVAEIAAMDAKAEATGIAAENLAMLETLLRSAPVGFAFVDREFRFVRMNDMMAELNGMSVEQALGQPVESIIPALWTQLEPLLRRVIDEQLAVRDVAISGETSARPGVRRDWNASYYPVLIADTAEISGVGIIVTEVTEHLRLEAQLRQAQKLEAVGLLAGGIAHDINNTLGVITLSAEYAISCNDSDPVRSELERILTVARSSSRLSQQLLQFSRDQPVTTELVDASACVKSVAAFLQPTLGDHISVTIDAEAVASILVNRGQLEQLLVNLAINSRDAMPHGGELIFSTCELPITDPTSGGHAGRWVEICVQDSGTGMTSEVVERAFEPFFTTRAEHGGSGLGLATVYGIVRAAGGDVRIDSTPGQGTKISVRLPVSVESVTVPEPVHEAAGPPHAAYRVLVVDDQEALRIGVERILRHAGYDVQGGTAREIIEKSQVDSVPPDLLLTDLVMPDISGPELARVLGRRWPGLAVLYMSGYSAATFDSYEPQFAPDRSTVLPKPFASADLLRAVALELQRAEGRAQALGAEARATEAGGSGL